MQSTSRRHAWKRLVASAGAVLLLLAGAGCAGLQSPDGNDPRPTAFRPRWSAARMADHLEFFAELGEGPTAEERAAAYLAARMRASLLQPVLEDTYRLFYLEAGGPGPGGVAGYVAGKHPERARELVVVCAAVENGVAAAAVLDVARNYARFAQFGLVPERSVLFMIWTGGTGGAAGLQAFLRRPVWAPEAMRAVIYVGLAPGREAALRDLVERRGMRFYAVPLRADAFTAAGAGSDVEREEVEETSTFDRVVARAWPLAERTHELLRMEVVSGGNLLPTLGDTLRTPSL